MKDKRGMMADLARQLNEPAAEPKREASKPESRKARKPAFRRAAKAAGKKPAAAAAPGAEATGLEKMTIKLKPVVRNRILAESFRRKAEGDPNWQIQEIVSEAVDKHLGNG
jgi:hypothetical protein